MNKAQKRMWLCLLISLATLLISSIVIIYVWSSGIDIYDFSTPTRIRRFRLFGSLGTIPLILMVVTQWGWKKVYDERDRQIDRQAAIYGSAGALFFLGGAAWFLTVATKMGSIKTMSVAFLVYLTAFVWCLVSSIVALIQYGGRARREKS